MDAWLRDTHRPRNDRRGDGSTVALPRRGGDCGALHVHAGLDNEARRLAERVMASMPGARRSRELGRLRRGDEGLRPPARHGGGGTVRARVVDVREWLADRIGLPAPVRSLPGRSSCRTPATCVTRRRTCRCAPCSPTSPRSSVDDDGLCCGAGGAYSTLQPELAGEIRERKLGAIRRAGPQVVASATGCAMHLAAPGWTFATRSTRRRGALVTGPPTSGDNH
jgi:glycolate oxidase iron-sulfur subunit